MKDREIYIKRIETVQKKMEKGSILFLFAAKESIRNRDVDYKFRQDSDFYYLTGINEKDSILVLTSEDSFMFCLPKDKTAEIWTGIRLGNQAIKKDLKLTKTFDLTDFPNELKNLLENKHILYHFWGKNPELDRLLMSISHEVSLRVRDGKYAPEKFIIPYFIHEMRLKKSDKEIKYIQEAAEITREGHYRLMTESLPGMYEFQLESILEETYLKRGAWGGGYNHIVASGKNACILHYVENNSRLNNGDVVLVDSGAEKNYYTADVTRSFPVDKNFTPAARHIYEVVLASQKNAIKMCNTGTKFYDIHDSTVRFLSDCLIDMGLLKGSLDKVVEKGLYKKYFMHKIGHYLGMDVHDVGKYFINGDRRALESGMIVTIEPGLYFDPSDSSIPKEFRGIGIRIEDDILISGKNPINLTESIPKEVEDIEALREIAYSTGNKIKT